MKKRALRKLRSLLVELERNNIKVPTNLGALLQSATKGCIRTLGHLPRADVRVKLPFKGPTCEVCRKPLRPMAKAWTSNFGITYPLRCTNLKCSEQGKRKNYIPTKRKLVGKLSELQRPDCPVSRDKCPECKKQGFETMRMVFRVGHPSTYIHNRDVAWFRRCPRKGCSQRPEHFKEDGTPIPHRGKGVPIRDDPNRPVCPHPKCNGFGQPMNRSGHVKLLGFGPAWKYICRKGLKPHFSYVTGTGQHIAPLVPRKPWNLDALPLEYRKCPRPGCTIQLRLGPRGGTIRQKAESLYGAKGKRLGRRRRFGEEEYRYVVCRGTGKKKGHGTVAIASGSVRDGSFHLEVLPPKVAGRPKTKTGMTDERIAEAKALLQLVRKHGGRRGSLQKAVAELYPREHSLSAYQKANKILTDYRRVQKTGRK